AQGGARVSHQGPRDVGGAGCGLGSARGPLGPGDGVGARGACVSGTVLPVRDPDIDRDTADAARPAAERAARYRNPGGRFAARSVSTARSRAADATGLDGARWQPVGGRRRALHGVLPGVGADHGWQLRTRAVECGSVARRGGTHPALHRLGRALGALSLRARAIISLYT